MTYSPPSISIIQDEFLQSPVETTSLQRTVLIGGLADVLEFDLVTGTSRVTATPYDNGMGSYADYTLPGLITDAVIDPASIGVRFKNAHLEIWSQEDDGANDLTAEDANTIKSTDLVFATTPQGAHTSAAFGDRGVRVNDRIVVDYNGTSISTYVRSILPEQLTPEVGDASPSSANAPSTTVAKTVLELNTATSNSALVLDASAAAYDGLATGRPTEIYTITVTQASTGGDPTTARLSVTSQDGLDVATGVQPAAYTTPFAAGARGMTLTLTDPTTSGEDLELGFSWRVSVSQAYESLDIVAGGTYTSAKTRTYAITVTRGGEYADADANLKPQISAIATDGTDSSGPTTVADPDTPVAIGSHGLTVTFAELDGAGTTTGMARGEVFSITGLGNRDGVANRIRLADELPLSLQTAPKLGASIRIYVDTDIPSRQEHNAPAYNWTYTGGKLRVQPGIEIKTSAYTESGVEVALPVITGEIHASHRQWLAADIGVRKEADATDPSALLNVPGPLDANNPLKYSLAAANANAAIVPVSYIEVGDPAVLDGWEEAFDALSNTDIYNIVLVNPTDAAINAAEAFVGAESAASVGRSRALWLPVVPDVTVPIVNATYTTDGLIATASVLENVAAEETEYTRVVFSGVNARLLDREVAAGDKLRITYGTNDYGDTTYVEYTVAEVVNEVTLLLESGPQAELPVPQRAEIWRTLSKQAQAEDIAAQSSAYGNRRVRAVWSDHALTPADQTEMSRAAAAAAGRASGVVPHQTLTNLELSGLSVAGRSTRPHFSTAQLNTLGGGHTYVISRNPSGSFVTRDAIGSNGVKEMATRNQDSVARFLRIAVESFFRNRTVTTNSLNQFRTYLTVQGDTLRSRSATPSLGGQIENMRIASVQRSTVDPGAVEASILIDYPEEPTSITVTLIGRQLT